MKRYPPSTSSLSFWTSQQKFLMKEEEIKGNKDKVTENRDQGIVNYDCNLLYLLTKKQKKK